MSEIRVDTISEKTTANGVSIDSVTLKDGGATLSDNLLFNASGKGVYLGVTSATASNLLDDYETGTWTPVFTGETTTGSYSYSFQDGYYTKIGNTVHASFRLINITNVSAGSGNVVITGLPFTVANDGIPNHQSVFTTYFTASTDSDWQLSLDHNNTTFRFRRVDSGSGVTMQVSNKVNNLADIYTLFTYRVA